MPEDVVIVGIGMVTPLGLNAEQTAASIHSGMSAFEESPFDDKAFQPLILGFLPDDVLQEPDSNGSNAEILTSRELRLVSMSGMAIKEALEPLGGDIPDTEFFLGLPESIGDQIINDIAVADCLMASSDDHLKLNNMNKYSRGRASGLMAIHRGISALTQGDVSMALAGGVDSYFDVDLLEKLDWQSRINSEANMDGFIPGEGAAFLLLTTISHAQNNGLEVLGRFLASATGEETGHLYSEEPYRGEGLAETITDLIGKTNGSFEKIPTVFSSMNGESHFAKEWGVAYLRNQKKIESDFRIEHPADCIGDSGAACGPIMTGLALTALREGYLSGPILVYASSDSSCRAACIVSGV